MLVKPGHFLKQWPASDAHSYSLTTMKAESEMCITAIAI